MKTYKHNNCVKYIRDAVQDALNGFVEILNDRFYLDPESPSGLRNKRNISSSALAGEPSGTPCSSKRSLGYWQVQIQGKLILSHDIVVVLGSIDGWEALWRERFLAPSKSNRFLEVDHIEGTEAGNGVDNLRIITHKGNMNNTKKNRK